MDKIIPPQNTSSPITNLIYNKCPYCWCEFKNYEEYKLHLTECGIYIYSKRLS